MLLRDTRHHLDDRDGWYIFESIASPGEAAASLTTVLYGVRLSTWQRHVLSSDDITLRHLHYQHNNKPSSDALKAVVNRYIGRPYEQNVSEMVEGVLDANTTEDASSFSCSELTAHVLQDLDLLSKDKIASNFMPAHFSLERDPSALPLINAHLGREHEIVRVERSVFRKVFESVTGVLRFFARKLRMI